MRDLGTDGVMCLVATEDEAFTYKKRVNRLATIQERKMILQAIERGVPQKRIAKALDVDVHNIRRKRRLRARDELGDARLHDFRLTVGTYGGQAGFKAFLVRNLLGHKTLSFYRLWYGKRPRSNQDLFTGLINPRRKVPSLADRQAVDAIVLATAKTDCDGAVLVGLGGYIVEAVSTAIVLVDIAVRVVDGNRPESVDGNVLDRDRMGSSVVFFDDLEFVDGIPLG